VLIAKAACSVIYAMRMSPKLPVAPLQLLPVSDLFLLSNLSSSFSDRNILIRLQDGHPFSGRVPRAFVWAGHRGQAGSVPTLRI
jgi:hypothetical protein